jgi:hypothetical protein
MNLHLSTVKKLDLLQKKLSEDLQFEHTLELQISQEYEELKHLEGSLEKRLEREHLAKQLDIKH